MENKIESASIETLEYLLSATIGNESELCLKCNDHVESIYKDYTQEERDKIYYNAITDFLADEI